MFRRPSRRLAALVLGVAGCQSSSVLQDTTTLSPVATASEVISTVVTVRWTTPEPSVGYVEYGLDGAFDQATPVEDEASLEHSMVVLGLKAGRDYDFRVVSETGEGTRTESETVSLSIEPPPPEMARLTLSAHDEEGAASGGFVLTSVMQPGKSWVVILDRDGDYVWYWPVDANLAASTSKFNPYNHSVTYVEADVEGFTDQGRIWRVSLDGTEVVPTRVRMGHHDYAHLPDGKMAWLAFDFQPASIGDEWYPIAGDDILELEEGGTDEQMPYLAFSMLDHIEPFVPCSHFWEEVFTTGHYDFSHANSLVYEPNQDLYFVMSRNLDALFAIDRSTGEIVSTIGGGRADIATEDPTDMWSHGHLSHVWDGGFMVFDNGIHREPAVSRILEYAYDLDAGTLDLVWEWQDGDDLYNEFFGDAQKLRDSYLTVWTGFGMIEEVSRDGSVVWKVEAEVGNALGRSTWVDDLYDLSDVGSH